MATHLHHIQPWIHRSIAEAGEHLERKKTYHIEQKISEVHNLLDAFELQVLALSASPVDMSTFQASVESLRVDIDMILDSRVPQYKAPSAEPAEDTVLVALFATFEIPPSPPREHAKRRRSRQEDESRARKKDLNDMEAMRTTSIADMEELSFYGIKICVRPLENLEFEIKQ